MKNSRRWLLAYTGLYIIVGIWTPVLWFISSARTKYQMSTFELSSMHWSAVVFFILLVCATLIAQHGFVVLAQEQGEYEQQKDGYTGGG